MKLEIAWFVLAEESVVIPCIFDFSCVVPGWGE